MAFLEIVEDCDSGVGRPLCDANGAPIVYVLNNDGSSRVKDRTLEASRPSRARSTSWRRISRSGATWSGVHYYSDYYDSLRKGDRIAVGILLEQAPCYGDAVAGSCESFDGDLVTISGEGGSCPALVIIHRAGNPVSPRDW